MSIACNSGHIQLPQIPEQVGLGSGFEHAETHQSGRKNTKWYLIERRACSTLTPGALDLHPCWIWSSGLC